MYSLSILHHNFEVSRQLISWFQRKHDLIFFLNPIWLSNQATFQLFLTKFVQACLGEHLCAASSRSVQPFWRRILCFRVNPILLPNHVTYDIIFVKLLLLMERRSFVKCFASTCSALSKIFEGFKYIF